MNIFLSVIGTRGDLEMFLILGRELKRRGHGVLVGASSFYSGLVRASNLEWMQIGSGTHEQMQAVVRSFSDCPDLKQRPALYYRNWFAPQLNESISAICERALASDYFISNTKMCLWQADRAVPGACVTYDPPASLEELANPESHLSKGRIIELVAMNKALIDPQNQWGQAFGFTGFWLAPNPAGWTPPEALLRFLTSGPPPVAVTMGSMIRAAGAKLLPAIMESLRSAGQRGVILGDWGARIDARPSGQDFHFAMEIPYHYLFPRTSCVIHHGGIGTVAATLASGVPSIVLPQIPAQLRIGEVLTRQGLAAGVLDSQALDCRELSRAIRSAATEQKFAQQARAWRELVRRDRGVVGAADLIEMHLKQLGQRPEVQAAPHVQVSSFVTSAKPQAHPSPGLGR